MSRNRWLAGGSVAALAVAVTLLALPWGPVPQPADRPLPALSLPAERPLVITALGTSLTQDASWPGAFGAALEACLGHQVRVEVIARSGGGSAWALGATGQIIAARPGLVLAEFAINDADLFDGVAPSQAYAQHLRLASVLTGLDPAPAVLWMTMNPAHGLRGWVRPRLGRHYLDYRRLAAETNTGLLDLWPRWRAMPRAARRFRDGLHPDPDQAEAVILPPLLALTGNAYGRECAI